MFKVLPGCGVHHILLRLLNDFRGMYMIKCHIHIFGI